MIETGTILQNRYRIDRQIGQGGMGAVYIATDERFGSTVAIKETLFMDDNFRKAIEREARLLNSLKHPALPRVSDHFEENNGQFIVMEYIPGEDVAHMLEADRTTFSVEKVLNWADQLLDALDYLHNQEMPVIHRDIKPQNLKINSRGQIILLDFGLAKGNPNELGHQTAAKSIFGYSRNYASLEQIQGTGTDPRSDLYSLAATLYHMLTGVPPEDALTRAMSVLSQRPDPLVPAVALNSDVPKGVAGVLQKALDLNAASRPASAEEMRRMLRNPDEYAYLADAVDVSRQTSSHVLGQPTRLMGDQTHAMPRPDTDVQTLVYAADPLHAAATDVQRPVTGGSNGSVTGDTVAIREVPKKRSFGVAAGVLSAVLVLCAAAVGLYLDFRPAPEQIQTAGQQPQPDTSANSPDANSSSIDLGPDAFLVSGANVQTQQVPAQQTTAPQSAAKPNETSKNPKNSVAVKTAKDEPKADIEFTSDDPDIPPGGVVITRRDERGKLSTMRVNPKVPNPAIPPMRVDPYVPGGAFDFQHLNDQQRRKLQRIWADQQRRLQNLPNGTYVGPRRTPTPPPQPEQ